MAIPELQQRMTETFPASLNRFSLTTLEQEQGTVYAFDHEFRLTYVNPAWFIFSADNGGEPAISQRFVLGASLENAIQGPLHDYYVRQYQQAMQYRTPWQHDYECSSADEFRLYHQQCYPIDGGRMLVVINSLTAHHPHPHRHDESLVADESRYRDKHGFITQCSHCRRVQRPDEPERWDWISSWVRYLPPDTSHSLCYPCFDYYYLNYNKS